MNIIEAIILGIVEGITEFLPISSTGHLILTSHLLVLPETEFLKSFEVIIQLGAIASVIFLYWRLLLQNFSLWKKLFVAFLPAAGFGFAAYPFIKSYLLGNETVVLAALFIGGILLIAFEKYHQEHPESTDEVVAISYKQALAVGLFQCLALVPGVSRAGATILGGLFVGLKRKAIVEFSFLLAIPTMLGASALDISESLHVFTPQNVPVLAAGFITAFVVALFAIKFLLHIIRRNTFVGFGVYRIVIAIIFWLALI